MINLVKFYDQIEDSDFIKQFVAFNLLDASSKIINLPNKLVPPFQCNLGSSLNNSFSVSIEVVRVKDTDSPIDISSEINITRVKDENTGNLFAFHTSEQVADSLLEGLVFFRITANDGSNTVVKYSDVMCSKDGIPIPTGLDILDGGQNTPITFADILDGGQNAVLD